MAYNMSFTNGTLNLFTMTAGINDASGQIIPLLLLFIVFLVSFAGFYKLQRGNDWVISSFITTVVGGLMFFLGVLAWEYTIIPLVLLVGSIIVKYMT